MALLILLTLFRWGGKAFYPIYAALLALMTLMILLALIWWGGIAIYPIYAALLALMTLLILLTLLALSRRGGLLILIW